MGAKWDRFTDAALVLLGKEGNGTDRAPINVKVRLSDGRVLRPVLLRTPTHNGTTDVFWTAYGPETCGLFDGVEIIVDELPKGVHLDLALRMVLVPTGGRKINRLTFAPMPANVAERVAAEKFFE